MTSALERLNAASTADAAALLAGLYEHSPWVTDAVVGRRPFASRAALERALCETVRDATRDAKLALIRAHPDLGARGALTAASTDEQSRAGLFAGDAKLASLNAAYRERFGWPFVLAVKGPRGRGLAPDEIVATFERRLAAHPDVEFDECLRQIDRIAQIRLAERLDDAPARGAAVWDQAESLARFSDPGYAEFGQLTVTYLTDAHRSAAATLAGWMRDAGFDEVRIDAVGNVVGVYLGSDPDAQRLLTGSHYDTVRNGGRFDGRLGILVPIACVAALHRAGRRLPFGIEVIGFAEEEGQRYKATFLGSGALTGHFDAAWLAQADADGITMADAMRHAGLPATTDAIDAETRAPSEYLGFVEVHIEQGPVLSNLGLPLGIVTSINGGRRFVVEVVGVASHAGTTPMHARRDAIGAAAELALYLEQRAAKVPDLVGTMGILGVPGGSINVVPGRCRFTLDIRATTDPVRDACVDAVLATLDGVCMRRGLSYTVEETMRAAACPSDPAWQSRWEAAVASLGLPIFRMPSGAGHDAMKLHEVMPQAMLFVRGENDGISHNPLESSHADDIELAIRAFDRLLDDLATMR